MKNMYLSYFYTPNGEPHKGSICDDSVQYIFVNKTFEHYEHGLRMVNNVELDEDKFVNRVIEKLTDGTIDDSLTRRFMYDKDWNTNLFLFKVSIYGHVLFACDTDERLNAAVRHPELSSEIKRVFEEFKKIMV